MGQQKCGNIYFDAQCRQGDISCLISRHCSFSMSLTIQPFKPDFFGMQKKTEQSYCVAGFQVSESTALLVQVCVMSKGASQGTRRDISFLS